MAVEAHGNRPVRVCGLRSAAVHQGSQGEFAAQHGVLQVERVGDGRIDRSERRIKPVIDIPRPADGAHVGQVVLDVQRPLDLGHHRLGVGGLTVRVAMAGLPVPPQVNQ